MKNVKTVAPRRAAAVPSFSTLLDKKELAEETKYIRSLEAKRQEEVRQNLEKILALDDSHADKQQLIGLLEKKEEPKGLIAKWGLNDWKFALPAALLVGIPAVYNEVIIIDAELQLTACFILFASTMYTQAGPIIAKTFDDYSNEVEKDLNNVNNSVHSQIGEALAANQTALTLEEDIKSLHALTDQVAIAHAEVLNKLEEHKYREAIVKKLESLQALEEAASSAVRQRIVTSVKSDVLTTFKSNKKVQETALEQAIAVLTAGTSAKLGKDVVGDVFVNSIKTYRDNYAKQPAGSDEILKKLEKDVAALASAPEVSGKGGNVFPVV